MSNYIFNSNHHFHHKTSQQLWETLHGRNCKGPGQKTEWALETDNISCLWTPWTGKSCFKLLNLLNTNMEGTFITSKLPVHIGFLIKDQFWSDLSMSHISQTLILSFSVRHIVLSSLTWLQSFWLSWWHNHIWQPEPRMNWNDDCLNKSTMCLAVSSNKQLLFSGTYAELHHSSCPDLYLITGSL